MAVRRPSAERMLISFSRVAGGRGGKRRSRFGRPVEPSNQQNSPTAPAKIKSLAPARRQPFAVLAATTNARIGIPLAGHGQGGKKENRLPNMATEKLLYLGLDAWLGIRSSLGTHVPAPKFLGNVNRRAPKVHPVFPRISGARDPNLRLVDGKKNETRRAITPITWAGYSSQLDTSTSRMFVFAAKAALSKGARPSKITKGLFLTGGCPLQDYRMFRPQLRGLCAEGWRTIPRIMKFPFSGGKQARRVPVKVFKLSHGLQVKDPTSIVAQFALSSPNNKNTRLWEFDRCPFTG